jgi:hypothetical protein
MNVFIATLVLLFATQSFVFGDGKVMPPRNYTGSLEEKAQEAIIVFTPGTSEKSAVQDLIIKIQVEGKVNNFAWVVPLPSKPTTHEEDAVLFKECFSYVQSRLRPHTKKSGSAKKTDSANEAEPVTPSVEVLSREVVGSYDVAIVKENAAGALNMWLKKEGFQELKDAEDVIGFYRKKDYVFACMKVADTKLSKTGTADLHPLRFTFETGGRDGIYFPMKMTSLQEDPFDVNLYIFYRAWLNDHINGYGFEHRGFDLKWRDYDTNQCKANAGKTWSAPKSDPYLKSHARKIPELTRFFQARHAGKRFYLTNITARGLKPKRVRTWDNDLWMFPHYTDKDMIPYDAREGEAAAVKLD